MAEHLKLINEALMMLIHREVDARLMLVELPPRHGKSEFISKWLPAWYLTKFPSRRVMHATYGSEFGRLWGRRSRAIVKEFGPAFGVGLSDEQAAMSDWETDQQGSMICAGVGGMFTGRGADLLIGDDLIKNSEEALSKTIRDSTWDWWETTARTRLEPNGVAVVIGTRWHDDDPLGRMIQNAKTGGDKILRVRLPALAEDGDLLGRAAGEALWPERYDAAELNRIRRGMSGHWWQAMYQQNPVPREGGMFKFNWFKAITPDEIPRDIYREGRAVRYWDHAATQDGGDYTVGVLMVSFEGRHYVLDVCRGQWSPQQRRQKQKEACRRDAEQFEKYRTWAEEEGGSSGKEAAALFVKEMADFDAATERVTGPKEVRAESFANECDCGNVFVLQSGWTNAYINELCAFPHGVNDDQVDASSGAFNKLKKPKRSFVLA